jgi:hypothetical protein
MLSFLDNPKNFGKKKQKGLGAWTKVMGPHTCPLIFFAQARIIYYPPFYFLKNKASDVSFACPSFGHRRDC